MGLYAGLWERKVWTSQERIPVKDWGPQGYGKCNREHSADHLWLVRQGEMHALGALPYLGEPRVL